MYVLPELFVNGQELTQVLIQDSTNHGTIARLTLFAQ
jgi:hypothetical protein